MRACPVCHSPMQERLVFGVEIDACPLCRGVFLDPGEAEAQGIDTSALFGGREGAAQPLGPSTRLCPAHGQPMVRHRIVGGDGSPVDIDRAACCGGIFLDPGEQADFAAAAERAAWLAGGSAEPPRRAPAPTGPSTGTVRTATGAVFAAPPAPGIAEASTPMAAFVMVARGLVAAGSGPSGAAEAPSAIDAHESTSRACPRCGSAYQADRTGGVEVDVCDGCGSMFFDPGEVAAKGIETAALFGVGPSAAQLGGPSELRCPACDEPMQVVRITTLAGTLEVDRATCCGGLFLDGGELDPFVRAAQVAHWSAADEAFLERGAVAGEPAMVRAMSEAMPSVTASFVRGRVDAMLARALRRRRRHPHHHDGYDPID